MTVAGGQKRAADALHESKKAPWREPRILSTLFLVFLAGAASGALSMRLGLHDRLRGAVSPAAREATREPNRELVLRKFQNELDLSGDQSDKLALVLDDYGHYYKDLQDQLEDLRSTGKNQILAILNPDQRERFEKMMNDLAPQLAPAPPQAK